MKNAKKVFAMLIVLALAISMAIPVSAATGELVIKGTIKDQTYNVYKMADAIRSADGSKITYIIVEAWNDFFESKGYKPDANGQIMYDGDISDVQAFAQDAVKYAKDNSIAAVASPKGTGSNVTVKPLAEGYYCVETTTGTMCAIGHDGSTVIAEKNKAPTITKLVDDNGTYKAANDANIGDTVKFNITVTKQTGAINYVVHDTLSSGLTFDKIESVKFNGVAAKAGDYTLSGADDDDNIFTITLNNAAVAKLVDGQQIEIIYTAILNNNAVIESTGNSNSANLTYGHNGDLTTTTVSTNTYTYAFDLFKYYESGSNKVALPGAEFVLQNADGKYLTFAKTDNTYKYTGVAENVAGATTLVSSNGNYVIEGLDEGTYTLTETKAPDGYNKLTETKSIVITGKDVADGTHTLTNDTVTATRVEVLNQSGAILPETGATGTIIFITVGGLMVVAMGVLLVVRKRMSKVVYTR